MHGKRLFLLNCRIKYSERLSDLLGNIEYSIMIYYSIIEQILRAGRKAINYIT